MKALLVSAAAICLLAPIAQAPVAQARPSHQRVPVNSHPVLAPLEQAATGCFAETVMANPKAMGLAREGRWYEAAGVIGFLCRPEVGRMVAAHDSLYGKGSGDRFFKREYARHLDQQLALRLQPLLTTKAVASAEPPIEKAVLSEEAEPAKGATAP